MNPDVPRIIFIRHGCRTPGPRWRRFFGRRQGDTDSGLQSLVRRRQWRIDNNVGGSIDLDAQRSVGVLPWNDTPQQHQAVPAITGGQVPVLIGGREAAERESALVIGQGVAEQLGISVGVLRTGVALLAGAIQSALRTDLQIPLGCVGHDDLDAWEGRAIAPPHDHAAQYVQWLIVCRLGGRREAG